MTIRLINKKLFLVPGLLCTSILCHAHGGHGGYHGGGGYYHGGGGYYHHGGGYYHGGGWGGPNIVIGVPYGGYYGPRYYGPAYPVCSMIRTCDQYGEDCYMQEVCE